jgi:hypothetical protein
MSADVTYKIDRTGWDAGPWDGEPDRVDFKSHGFPCLILRNDQGNLCGYVAVPPDHPGINRDDLSVHGGVTYGSKCHGNICHVPEPGEPDDVYWIGFDCAHWRDVRPGSEVFWRKIGIETDDPKATYKDINYVRGECESLAAQLALL